jgi:hypothetical protein
VVGHFVENFEKRNSLETPETPETPMEPPTSFFFARSRRTCSISPLCVTPGLLALALAATLLPLLHWPPVVPLQQHLKIVPLVPIPFSPLFGDSAFLAAVNATAHHAEIVLVVCEASFLPMLSNFILTSVIPLRLVNVLVVSLSPGLCEDLESAMLLRGARSDSDNDNGSGSGSGGGATCWHYATPRFSSGAYGTLAFSELVQAKTEVLMAVVRLGYTGKATLLCGGDRGGGRRREWEAD